MFVYSLPPCYIMNGKKHRISLEVDHDDAG